MGLCREPGFCRKNLDALSQLAQEHKAKGSQLTCSLIFDEMSIRKHLQWSDSQKIFIEHVNYGSRPNSTAMPVANNAIVFMVNGVGAKFNFPIANYFINSLNTDEKIGLLMAVVTEIRRYDVRVLSVTFDGLNTNSSMCETVGATFQPNNWKPYILFPGDERRIYIIFDPSHMLKLARNCIENIKILLDDDNLKFESKVEIFRRTRAISRQ